MKMAEIINKINLLMTTSIYQPSKEAWNEIKDAIIRLENEAFADKAFSNEELEKDFLNPRNIIALLKNEKEVIGFTYARPLDEADEPGRESEASETAYVWDSVIDKRYRGKGLLRPLMIEFESELKRRGYSFMERTSMVANNYAANITKHYGDRIVRSEPIESKYGKQVFFRIRL
jgi:ribosomal protein S18 acetylase RimI-like enzyme